MYNPRWGAPSQNASSSKWQLPFQRHPSQKPQQNNKNFNQSPPQIENDHQIADLQKKAAQWQQSQQQNSHLQKSSKELQMVEQEERDFMKQYKDWKKQYDDWKESNKNHPNRQQFDQYERKWREYEKQMEMRRTEISTKKQNILRNLGLPADDKQFEMTYAPIPQATTLSNTSIQQQRPQFQQQRVPLLQNKQHRPQNWQEHGNWKNQNLDDTSQTQQARFPNQQFPIRPFQPMLQQQPQQNRPTMPFTPNRLSGNQFNTMPQRFNAQNNYNEHQNWNESQYQTNQASFHEPFTYNHDQEYGFQNKQYNPPIQRFEPTANENTPFIDSGNEQNFENVNCNRQNNKEIKNLNHRRNRRSKNNNMDIKGDNFQSNESESFNKIILGPGEIEVNDDKLYYDELYDNLPPYETRKLPLLNTSIIKPSSSISNLDVTELLSGVEVTGDLLNKAAEGLKLLNDKKNEIPAKRIRKVIYSAFPDDPYSSFDRFQSYLDDPTFGGIADKQKAKNVTIPISIETRKTVEKPKEVIDYGHGSSKPGDIKEYDHTFNDIESSDDLDLRSKPFGVQLDCGDDIDERENNNDDLKDKERRKEFSMKHRNYLEELGREREEIFSGNTKSLSTNKRSNSPSNLDSQQNKRLSNDTCVKKPRQDRKGSNTSRDSESDDESKKRERDIVQWRRERHDISLLNSGFGRFGPQTRSEEKLKVLHIKIDDLLEDPIRLKRPERIVILIRGPPGSGKSYCAKLIKERELKNGGTAPRLMSIDDYFMTEIEDKDINDDTGNKLRYDFDEKLENTYIESLLKAYKKQLDTGYFNFIVVDAVFDKTEIIDKFWSYAKVKGFQVFVGEMTADIDLCVMRNIHGRKFDDIKKILTTWQTTPKYCSTIDLSSLLIEPIVEIEMENNTESFPVVNSSVIKGDMATDQQIKIIEEQSEKWIGYKLSKWEVDGNEETLDKLDGLKNKSQRKKREKSPIDLEDYLSMDDDYYIRRNDFGKKRVRWADIEERKLQVRKKEIGFVVGQTASDWEKMTTDTDIVANRALNKMKYF